MEIRSLENTGFEELYDCFSEAFRDYEMQIDKEGLRKMLQRRGFDAGLSFGAFDGGKHVAFTFNGIGRFNGLMTAYDTGTGTLREYRGQGLAGRVFEHSIPYLRKAGIEQYLLEVLQHNTAAIAVYRKQGFEVTREFNYFIQDKDEIQLPELPEDEKIAIRRIDMSFREKMILFHDFHPSWQNSFEAIGRKPDDFIFLGTFQEDTITGYCIFEPASGDLTQIAVSHKYRRQGIATRLLSEVLQYNKANAVKIINTDTSCEVMTKFLGSRGITLKGKQFEMTRSLKSSECLVPGD